VKSIAPVVVLTVGWVPPPVPVQVTLISCHPAGIVSVMVVAVETAVSVCVAPVTPVPAVTVVIVWFDQPLVPVNVKPPVPPFEILVKVTVGRSAFVTVQAITEPGAVWAAVKSIAPVEVFTVGCVPPPVPVQVTATSCHPAGIVSVMVVAVETAVSVCVAPVTPVPAVTVVMVWLDQPFVPLNVKPPVPPLETFVRVRVGRLAFVTVQAIAEPGAVCAAVKSIAPVVGFTVGWVPPPVPVQVTLTSCHPAGIVSVMVVAVETAVSVCVAPVTPVPAVTVVMVWLDQPLVPVKVKPPVPPLETFVSVTVGRRPFVTVQAMADPGAICAAVKSIAPVVVFTVGWVPPPVPVQVTLTSCHPAGMVSVMVVAVETAVSVCVAPVTPVPETVVVMVWLVQPFVPVNVKPPVPPFETFVSVTVGRRVFVYVQAMLDPAAVAAELSTTAPVTKFGVAVPPVPNPVQEMEART
jgi:hypothetical protein